MTTARSFLIRGLLAGLFAGILAFGVAYIVGEPSVNASIAIEEAGDHDHGTSEAAPADDTAAHDTATHDTVVPRSLQSTLGLLTGTIVAGATLGGVVGVLSALALGRFGRAGVRSTTLAVAGIGFVAIYVLPFIAYPPNPPAVGHSDTIVTRTVLYFTMLAISLVAAIAAVIIGRRLAKTWGSWYAGLAVVVGYLVITLLAVALLPAYNEVPTDFPATVLYQFRGASFATQLTLWTVLGVTLAELLHRLGQRSVRLADAQQRYASASSVA